ncbi:MAG: hypothetical protein KDD45_04470 [Bdellovibrionales bacterium]|nr:hypothetical protein [Bdellovibrionales bacterium]
MEKSDAELLEKIAKGDSKSFEILLAKYKNKVYGLCKKILHDKHLSEEISQDVWLQVIQSADSYKTKTTESALPWIMVMARNKCLNF